MDFTAQLQACRQRVERGLEELVPAVATRPARLHAAMRYSLQAGGKRLRPVLVLAAADLFAPPGEAGSQISDLRSQISNSPATLPAGGLQSQIPNPKSPIPNLKSPIPSPQSQISNFKSQIPDPLPAAVALECLHTYSLIHDDLPCMDNDDLRRGRPTAHKQFDEATALLAGDALLTLAFQLLGRHYASNPALGAALLREIADAAGSEQLIGGQMEDLLAEKNPGATADDLDFIHRNKTAAILGAALVAGGLCGGATASQLATLREAGRHLGLAFQIVDDILDATADTATLGKTAGKDAKAGKTTYVKIHGLDAARRYAREQSEAAKSALARLPGGAPFLTALVENMAKRNS